MSFVARAFGGGNSRLERLQAQQIAEQRAATRRQEELIAERERRTKLAEEAQRRVRRFGQRGLLAYSDAQSGLSDTLGG